LTIKSTSWAKKAGSDGLSTLPDVPFQETLDFLIVAEITYIEYNATAMGSSRA
jgi:hypothetical protein